MAYSKKRNRDLAQECEVKGRFVTPSDNNSRPALPFEKCPAKTWICQNGSTRPGRNVFNHCQIVGETARALISLFPKHMQARLFPAGSELAAAGHDIGKVSPTFVAKIFAACGQDISVLPALAGINHALEKSWGGHAGVSQTTAEELRLPQYVPEILGQHHGFSPPVADKCGDAEVFGGSSWFDERKKLVTALKESLKTDWPTFENVAQARVVAGLTSVADWIGSGKFFENPAQDWRPAINEALADAGFVAPVIRKNLSFNDLFGSSENPLQPRSIQANFIQAVSGPGVYILEAQMGEGKTEAALYAAYRMLVEGVATGIYFALPTQLTSNKIYDRFNQFLDRILDGTTSRRALLLHSGAWLLENSEMGEEGRPGGSWFNQNKRGLLAPFAVGTIDQALMAVMNVKHGFVRAFGLAGKVVILDEVHSYDLYTGTLLNELVHFLRQVECTVIILSATLNQTRRNSLTRASGFSSEYPIITACHNGAVAPLEIAVESSDSTPVSIHLCEQHEEAIAEALRRAEEGQQVLWIENTIAEAQQRYLDLAAKAQDLQCDSGLVHSRYTAQHRQENENYWVNLFGKAGLKTRANKGRILVGTQVLEQSLDIDADFLISRFAPSDMLLQRIGRLWRHGATPRHANASKDCWLIAPPLASALANPGKAFGKNAWVYQPYILCRSLEVWQQIKNLSLPSSIRSIIDATYIEREETDAWASMLLELKKGTRYRTGQEAQEALAKLTLSHAGKTLPEHKAETRYSDQDTLDVLLLRSIKPDVEKKITRLRLLDNKVLELPLQQNALNKTAWRQIAVQLHQQIVRVKPSDCPPQISRDELKKMGFHHVFYLGQTEFEEALLRVALVSDSGKLLTLDGLPLSENYHFEYDNHMGYRLIPKN